MPTLSDLVARHTALDSADLLRQLVYLPQASIFVAEARRDVPSWRRVCKALLRNDYWCKGLSFSQHKSAAYEKYLKVMKTRRRAWGMR